MYKPFILSIYKCNINVTKLLLITYIFTNQDTRNNLLRLGTYLSRNTCNFHML